MVKKHYSYIILLLTLLVSGGVRAEVKHYVGAHVSLGEWTLWEQKALPQSSFGAAGNVGFSYELQVGPAYGQTHFLLHTGLSLQTGTTAFNVNYPMTFSLPFDSCVDRDGDKFEYSYKITNRSDRYNKLVAQIPIMIGVQHQHFYMLAGVKVGYNLLTTYLTSGTLTTYGKYKGLPDQYDDPEQQFYYGDSAINLSGYKTRDGKVEKIERFCVDATLEIGGRIGEIYSGSGFDVPKRSTEFRLAGFVDFGVTGFTKWSSKNPTALYNFPKKYDKGTNDMTSKLRIYDLMSSAGYITESERYVEKNNPKGVKDGTSIGHNIMVGLKFTVLFHIPNKGKCVHCYDNYIPSSGHGRRVHYEEE